MKKIFLPAIAVAALCACSSTRKEEAHELTLKDMLGDKFLIGTAMNLNQILGIDSVGAEAVAKHFNSVVAENVMKCEEIHPEEDKYFWDDADRFVEFGEKNGMTIIGHCLVWHSQCAPWFCVDDKGELVDKETLKNRLRDHIHTIVGRYKGRVHGWDVVNEAIVEDGSYRNSQFYQILGEEFIPLAFQYAHEADPDAELYLNDYGMNVEGRRNTYLKIINDLKSKGLRIDAIGMQSHLGMDYPDFEEYEKSLEAYAATGCKVMITELDMSALPSINFGANIADTVAFKAAMNPYPEGIPDSVSIAWNDRMAKFMDLYIRHADDISRVTAWGVSDGDSWKNDWPMPGRTDYPLLLDRKYQIKPFLTKYDSVETKNS